MSYYTQPQNPGYGNTGYNNNQYSPGHGGYPSPQAQYGYSRQQQSPQQPQYPSPPQYPSSPQYRPPSPQPPPPQTNTNYGYNTQTNYPYRQPSPQNTSFNTPNLNNTNQMSTSKPLYNPHDPKAPKAPTQYGSKHDSAVYDSDPKFGYDEKKSEGFLCCGGAKRFCCFVCCILILLIIGAVIAFVLWAKEPNIEFQGVIPSPNGSPAFEQSGNGFNFNFGLNISVDNPNVVGAEFTAIQAAAFYPGHDTAIGGGNLTHVQIPKKANTTIHFPFTIHYDPAFDPGFTIAKDIFAKCGFIPGSQKQKLQINYQVTLSFKVLAITLSPSFNKTAAIDCPIPPGTNIPGLSLLGI